MAVVGKVGWGKSTLLSIIMHELKIGRGWVKTNGRKAYVEQEPYIITGTIKENIWFGLSYDETKFNEAVEAWCLTHDLRGMPLGANTKIGEKGVTISGGQKARVALARAVYSNADIYLLDDPLSAVDPRVAADIFNKCINGYLKDKWRVLVTHQIQFLKSVKKIIYVEDGAVKLQGTYESLWRRGINFHLITQSYQKNTNNNEEEEVKLPRRKSIMITEGCNSPTK